MPKFADEKFSAPNLQTQDTTRREVTQVVASPVSTYVRPAESNLARLGEALGIFAAQADKAIENHEKIQGDQERLLGFKAMKTGEAMNPEASPYWQQGFIQAHWDTAAINAEDQLRKDYAAARDKPGFDVNKLIQDRAKTDLQGVSNPMALKAYMDRLGRLGSDLHQDYTKHQIGLMYEQRDTDFNTQQADLLSRYVQPDGETKIGSPAEFFAEHAKLREKFKVQGKTNIEMNASLLDGVNALSRKMNGNTDVYDIFYEKDPATKQSLVDMNPKLGEAVEKARYQASVLYDHYMNKQAHLQNGDKIESYWDAIRQGKWDAVSDEALASERTQHGALWDNGTYHSIRAARDAAKAQASALINLDSEAAAGNLQFYDEKDQKAWLERATGEEVAKLKATLDQPGGFAVDALKNAIKLNVKTGASVTVPWLKQLTESVANMGPDPNSKDGKPSPRFLAISQVYNELKNAPNGSMVGRYFVNEDAAMVMDLYNARREAGDDEATAFRQAFKGISPENKLKAQEFARSPAGHELVKNAVTNVITGWGSNDDYSRPNLLRTTGFNWPIIGGEMMQGSIPPDQSLITSGAYIEAQRYIRAGGSNDPSKLSEHLKEWARNNFVHDSTTNTVVGVPAGKAGKDIANAISSYTEKTAAMPEYKGGKVTLEHQGNGQYATWYTPKGASQGYRIFPDTNYQELLRGEAAKTHLDDTERASYTALQDKVRGGNLTTEDVANNSKLIGKLTSMGLWKDDAKKQSDFLSTKAGQDLGLLVQEAKKRGLSAGPISTNLSNIPDLAAKRPVAQMLMKQGDVSGALTVMGEGVALKAYNDPAKGTNIGIGYNIDMNIKTAQEDFRRAGITASVEEIKGGKVGISTEQAVRLYQVVKPRYEAIAREQFEKRYSAGSFDKLSPPERAVLTDIAYQSGKNVGKFTELFDSMMTKQAPNANALNLSWKDRNTGEMKLDTHRRNLRLNLLLGRFDLGMKHAGITN